MIDSTLIIVAVVVVLGAGIVAYLLGEIKSLKKELSSARDRSERSENPLQILSAPPGGTGKAVSPKIIEIEKQLDEIDEKLDWTKEQHLKSGTDRKALEAQYSNLIGQMVDFFVSENDSNVYENISSLTGEHDVSREGLQRSKKASSGFWKKSGTQL